MEGVLILAHGSKRQETERVLNSIINKIKEKSNLELIYSAYLQFSEQNMEAGIKYLIEQRVTAVKIVPMFLFDGVHVTEDIPHELNELKRKYPDIDFKLTGHLGDDDRIADIIIDRVQSA